MDKNYKKALKGYGLFCVILWTICAICVWALTNTERILNWLGKAKNKVKEFFVRKKKKFSKYETLELEDLD